MKLVVNTFLTLDGVMQAPGRADEDVDGGFPYGGWTWPYFDDESGQTVVESIQKADAFLLGRKTYDIFAGYWPNAPEDIDGAEPLNTKPKYVVSGTLGEPSWAGTTVLRGDAPTEVARLKAQPGGELNVQGSTELLQALHPLVDEYRLWIFPIYLGTGKRLFETGAAASGLELVETHTNSLGAIYAVYRPTGAPNFTGRPDPAT